MKLKGALKGGLINGLAIGVASHWFYLEFVYSASFIPGWPRIVSMPLNSIALAVLITGLLSIGPHAVIQTNGSVVTRREGFIVGVGAGAVAGVVVYLVVGALAGTMGVGVPLLFFALIMTESVVTNDANNLLDFREIWSRAIVLTYLIIIGHLILGALIGGLEGMAYSHFRSQKSRNQSFETSKRSRALSFGLVILTTALAGGLFLWWPQDHEVRESSEGPRKLVNDGRFAVDADLRVLMLGNSLTYYNDLNQQVERLAESMDIEERDVFAVRIAPGGYRICQHRGDMLNEQQNPLLRQALISGSEAVRNWDFVILQARSQVPGFGPDNGETRELFSCAPAIHNAAIKAGAATALLMTWGYWDGDRRNPNRYPDFMTMSNRIEEGYLRLARELEAASGDPCLVIPAGLAFRAVFEDEMARGVNPKSKDSLFRALYFDNGHPSLAGSYLTAAVVVTTLMAVPVEPATWAPPTLDKKVASYLRRIADEVVSGRRH